MTTTRHIARAVGVTSTSDSDAWTVGSQNGAAGTGTGAKPLIDHWNGAAWSQVATPPTPGNTASLAAVSASSPTDAWAVGRTQVNHSNFAAPPKATMLHAIALPKFGGDTQFVDVRAAFDDLPEEKRRMLVRLRSPHVYESSQSPRKMAALSPEERAKVPQTVQPLVIRHPESGRSALYLNTGRMEGVEGMPQDEAFKLIDELYAHATRSNYEYRHQWRAGDLVIWDNRSVMHQANADYDPAEYRFLYRIMLQGAPLQPAAA